MTQMTAISEVFTTLKSLCAHRGLPKKEIPKMEGEIIEFL
jgi:hypothetical protein